MANPCRPPADQILDLRIIKTPKTPFPAMFSALFATALWKDCAARALAVVVAALCALLLKRPKL